MLELHFIRTMLNILDFTIVFQGKKTKIFIARNLLKKKRIMFSMPRFLTRLIVVSNMVWKTINALVKEILLTLQLPYLNGPVEATNNHIKG